MQGLPPGAVCPRHRAGDRARRGALLGRGAERPALADLRADEGLFGAVDRFDHIEHRDRGGLPGEDVARNIGGPEVFALDELGRITLSHKGDKRTVVTDPTAGMFGAVKGDVLTDKGAHLAATRYSDWLA